MAYKMPTNVAWRRMDEEIVVLDLDSSVYYSLNDVAATIWEQLAEQAPVEKVIAAVEKEYDADRKTISADVNAFIKALTKQKLIIPS